MPVFYGGAYIRVKRQKLWLFSQKISIIYVWKCSKCTSASVSISCMVIKKNVKIKHINTNLLKGLSGYPWFIVKHIPDFDSLQLSQKTQFQNTLTYQNLFRLNIFAIYFPLKLIVFTVQIFSIITFSLYQTKVIFAFMKRTDVDHFYHKCVIEYWLIH